MKITQKKLETYKVKVLDDFNEFYPLITINDYTSTRKRFSILVGEKYSNEHKIHTNFTLYVWSNDLNSIIDLLNLDHFSKNQLKENSQKSKENGLELSYYSKKEINLSQKNNFLSRKKTKISGLNFDPIELNDLYNEIEQDLDFLIATTYNYSLKPYAIETFQNFQEAKMKIFFISQDSEYKTLAIAYKTKLIERDTVLKQLITTDNKKLFIMMKYIFNTFKSEIDENNMNFRENFNYDKFRKQSERKSKIELHMKNQFTLITDGKTLELIFQNRYLASHFKFLLVFCKQLICYEMNQFVKKNLILMVKDLYSGLTNETILAIGNSSGDLIMMQEADVSVHIKQSESEVFLSDIAISELKSLNNIIFIWSKIGIENVQKKLYDLCFAACFITYFRFFISFISCYRQSEIVPTIFFVLIFKNIIFLSLFSQFRNEEKKKIALLRRYPILYKQLNWRKNNEIEILFAEIFIPSFSLALLFFGITSLQEISSQGYKIKTVNSFQLEIYLIFNLNFFIKVKKIIFIRFLNNFRV